MNKIGIFFGTDTGTTRLIAKKMAKKLGDCCDKPLNVNRVSVADVLKYEALILGTPTYGHGLLPGKSTDIEAGSWEEFLPQLAAADLSGKRIALYGLGDQDKYADYFVDALFDLHSALHHAGAQLLGQWSTEGYTFKHSKALKDDHFLGLALDQTNQALLTDTRIDTWLDMIKAPLLDLSRLKHRSEKQRD